MGTKSMKKKKIIHKAKILTKEEVEANRSSAYEYIDFEKLINRAKRGK